MEEGAGEDGLGEVAEEAKKESREKDEEGSGVPGDKIVSQGKQGGLQEDGLGRGQGLGQALLDKASEEELFGQSDDENLGHDEEQEFGREAQTARKRSGTLNPFEEELGADGLDKGVIRETERNQDDHGKQNPQEQTFSDGTEAETVVL